MAMSGKQLTDTQIHQVFQQLGLSGSTGPLTGQIPSPPSPQPLYFPLSADSLSAKKSR
jgi:hypothetical protein